MKSVGKWVHFALRPLIRFVFQFFATTPRTRVWLTNEKGQVLLLKSWFGSQKWSLPGGGVEKDESPTEAVRRELIEEAGIDLPLTAFSELMTISDKQIPYKAVVFVAKYPGNDLPKLDFIRRLEIIDRKWYNIKDLPDDSSFIVREVHQALSLADNA